MTADVWLDPEGDLLPIQRYVEIRATIARWSRRLAEQVKQRVLNSDQMNEGGVDDPNDIPGDEPLAIVSGADSQSLLAI